MSIQMCWLFRFHCRSFSYDIAFWARLDIFSWSDFQLRSSFVVGTSVLYISLGKIRRARGRSFQKEKENGEKRNKETREHTYWLWTSDESDCICFPSDFRFLIFRRKIRKKIITLQIWLAMSFGRRAAPASPAARPGGRHALAEVRESAVLELHRLRRVACAKLSYIPTPSQNSVLWTFYLFKKLSSSKRPLDPWSLTVKKKDELDLPNCQKIQTFWISANIWRHLVCAQVLSSERRERM